MVVRRPSAARSSLYRKPGAATGLQGWRSRTVGLLLMGAFLALVGRGFYLQVINNDFLQQKGDSRYLRDIEISASRGKIVDRNGDMLAVSTPMKTIWAIPGDARTDEWRAEAPAGRLLDRVCASWMARSRPTRPLPSSSARCRRKPPIASPP
jgi:cell division protein FtsI (penicillin-binding protein 3)